VRLLRDYGLSIVLAVFFLGSWLIQSVAGWYEFAAQQQAQGQAGQLFGADGYIWSWLESTFENWQSEFLQLFTFVVLTTFLIHRKSHESRDDQDETQRQVAEIHEMVRNMEARLDRDGRQGAD
jgi:hypothetical protein